MKINAAKGMSLIIILSLLAILTGCPPESEKEQRNIAQDMLNPIFTIYPQSGNTNTIFEFDASGSTGANHADSLIKVRWDWEGDGTWDTPYSTNKYETHQYSTSGSYNVTLEIESLDGISKNTSNILIVSSGDILATVITAPITDISLFEAHGGGEVTDEGDWTVYEKGVCLNEDGSPTINDRVVIGGNGLGAFTTHIYNLNSATDYFIRAYALSNAGIAYGDQISFKTKDVEPCPGIPTVTWHGRTYSTVQIGYQCWMKENLNWETGNSWCYNNDPANCDTFGRLYDWETMMNGSLSSNLVPSGVQGICPNGWHIPSDEEWKILEGAVDWTYNIGDTVWDNTGLRGDNAGGRLKSTDHWFTPNYISFGFLALPAGWRSDLGTYSYIRYVANFWTSTEEYPSIAFRRILLDETTKSGRDSKSKEYGYSVRCIKN